MPAFDWILRNARLRDSAALVDVGIAAGVFTAVTPHLVATGLQELDLSGRVLLPGFVDPHVHLDKTYPDTTNESGTLAEAIERFAAVKRGRALHELRTNAARALDTAITNGVVAMRSHVDLTTPADLGVVAELNDLRRRYAALIDLELVALARADGSAESRTLLAAARECGIDRLGGAPALNPDPTACIDAVLKAATELGCAVDLHVDETSDPSVRTLGYLAERTRALGLEGRVTAGHCCSLAYMSEADADRILDDVAAAGIELVVLPLCNLVLVGRSLPIRAARARGIVVKAGSDNVQDAFNPFGGYDPLASAALAAQVGGLDATDEVLDLVTRDAITPYRPADCVVVDALSIGAALATAAPRLATFKDGRCITTSRIERSWQERAS